jgi:Domain of Unknown Function (DUF928)
MSVLMLRTEVLTTNNKEFGWLMRFLQTRIALLIISFSFSTSFSQAVEVKTKSGKKATVEFVRPKLPEGTAPGGRRTGGGRRDSCQLDAPDKLTALVPVTEEIPTVKNVWGLTTAERPNFRFYVPYTKNSGYPAEFMFENEKSTLIYKTAISLPQKPEIISVTLPNSIPPLVVDKQYRWFVKIYCDQEKQSSPVYVEGVVSRVNLGAATNQQLQTAQPLQKLAIYAQNGIWYETLETLVQLKQQNPQDIVIQNNWENLLTSIGLTEIVDKSIALERPSSHGRLSKQYY